LKNRGIKIILSAVIVIVMAATFLGVASVLKGGEGEKEILISIWDQENDVVLMEGAPFITDSENLGDFLWENKEDLQVIMSDSEYGRFLEGLLGLNTENMMEGPWWMYSYESPSQEIKMEIGNAPGVDSLGIHDGDIVEFFFTTDMGM
jgi:hypothetical protein